MRWIGMSIAVAAFLLPLSAWGQSRGHGQNHPPAETAPTGDVSPELETFGHAVAMQARPDQVGFFRNVLTSTDKALQLSRELQSMGVEAKNIAHVNALSLQLRDDLDDVEIYNRRLTASFSKLQQSGLKDLTKQLHKSYTHVVRDARTVQQLMEPGKVVPEQLATGAANLEKALSDFRTDQIRLGRDMGIPSK